MATFEEIKRAQASATETVPAGVIQAYAGLVPPTGWALCNGAVLSQATYARLYAALGSTWDAFAHPVDGTPTVNPGEFALPNLNGLYLANAGDSGGDARSLGVFQSQKTAKNGLTGNFASDSHSHGGGDMYAGIGVGTDGIKFIGASAGSKLTNTAAKYNFSSWTTNHPADNRTAPAIYGNTGTPSGSGSLSSTDAETRPATAPVNYIIKL